MKYENVLITEPEKVDLTDKLNMVLGRSPLEQRHLQTCVNLVKNIGYVVDGNVVTLSEKCVSMLPSIIDVLFETNNLYKRIEFSWKYNLDLCPVWCKVRDCTEDGYNLVFIERYSKILTEYPYIDSNEESWKYAEPLSDELQDLLNKEVTNE